MLASLIQFGCCEGSASMADSQHRLDRSEFALVEQGIRQIAPGLGIARLDLGGAPEQGFRMRPVLLHEIAIGRPDPGAGVLRIGLHRRLVFFQRFAVMMLRKLRLALGHQRGRLTVRHMQG
jgi:hypothetical protein